jgi:hypothetical protein
MPITKYENQTIIGKILVLEECWFINCVLRECALFYSGGAYALENVTLEDCKWKLRENAAQTYRLLSLAGMLKVPQIPPSMKLSDIGPIQ